MQERAALRAQVASSKQAFKSTVAVRLGLEAARRIRWARGPLPVIANLRDVRSAHIFDGLDRSRLLDDVSAPTALERADGDCEMCFTLEALRAWAPWQN